MGVPAHAQIVTNQTPLGFFTNVASRLLSSELNLNLDQIEIYPTNQYTPAVQRLLQVAANVYDASNTNFYPSVFRPLISEDSYGNVFITGYACVPSVTGPNDPQLATPFDINYIAGLSTTFSNVPDNIYGVPWIIGAKKGFPNFNEFSMENTLSVTRRLQFTRIPAVSMETTPTITSTNQMYLMGLNSEFGVELWNSYANSYPGTIVIGLSESNSMALTNDENNFSTGPLIFGISTNFIVNSWPGSGSWFSGNPNSASFVLPLSASVVTLTNSIYRSRYANIAATGGLPAPGLIPTNYFAIVNPSGIDVFETNSANGFHFPQFGMLMTNRLQVYMLDVNNGVYHVVDYVQFVGPNSSFNVNTNLADIDSANQHIGLWDTNYLNGNTPPYGPTVGILEQISSSKLGRTLAQQAEDGPWNPDPDAVQYGSTLPQQEALFQAFFKPGNVTETPLYASNSLTAMMAPDSPTRYVVQYITWQANDPLVHYQDSDVDIGDPNITTTPPPGVSHMNAGSSNQALPLTSLNLGRLNDRYMPWGGNPSVMGGNEEYPDTNAFNLAERDPSLFQSDDWAFPTNLLSNLSGLGQVHRGTPWQTIYLKSTPIDLATWAGWTGEGDLGQAELTLPTNDWHMASLLVALLNTNQLLSLMSINNANTNAWQALFDGLTVLTNTYSGQFSAITVSSNSPQAAIIASAIESNRLNQPGQLYHDVGDILSTPQLADQSPYLNLSIAAYQQNMSDEAYEMLPSQLLPLLRSDSIGSVTANNGQTVIQFSGYDGHAYEVQVSCDLTHWVSVSTNCPTDGTFGITNSISSDGTARFYRSLLLN